MRIGVHQKLVFLSLPPSSDYISSGHVVSLKSTVICKGPFSSKPPGHASRVFSSMAPVMVSWALWHPEGQV